MRIQHGYDRGGNRLYRRDLVAEAHSELYQYDQMNQLIDTQRGVLNATGTAITDKTFEEQFTFDTTGNWLNYKRDANGDGTFEVDQTRTHNAANEILTISGGNTLVSHDRNGCMTKVPKPLDNTTAYTLVYDAWNRLAQVKDDTSVVATYVYDARNHRIKKTVGTVVTLSYFNQNWQEIESIAAGVTTTNVYGLRYIDDVVCRVKNTEVLYALQDTNWNVVALVTPSGVVAERITYDSFGRVTFRNPDFTTKASSSYGWTKNFTGQTYDPETGLMLYRNRYYHTGLGRFITRDPIGYNAYDVNLYRYVENNPCDSYDSIGLSPKQNRPWLKYYPWERFCMDLKRKIRNLEEQLKHRIKDYQENKCDLPEVALGPNRDSRLGHRVLYATYRNLLQEKLQLYQDKCGKPGAPSLEVESECLYGPDGAYAPLPDLNDYPPTLEMYEITHQNFESPVTMPEPDVQHAENLGPEIGVVLVVSGICVLAGAALVAGGCGIGAGVALAF